MSYFKELHKALAWRIFFTGTSFSLLFEWSGLAKLRQLFKKCEECQMEVSQWQLLELTRFVFCFIFRRKFVRRGRTCPLTYFAVSDDKRLSLLKIGWSCKPPAQQPFHRCWALRTMEYKITQAWAIRTSHLLHLKAYSSDDKLLYSIQYF